MTWVGAFGMTIDLKGGRRNIQKGKLHREQCEWLLLNEIHFHIDQLLSAPWGTVWLIHCLVDVFKTLDLFLIFSHCGYKLLFPLLGFDLMDQHRVAHHQEVAGKRDVAFSYFRVGLFCFFYYFWYFPASFPHLETNMFVLWK